MINNFKRKVKEKEEQLVEIIKVPKKENNKKTKQQEVQREKCQKSTKTLDLDNERG